ncbi:4Fe-4S dicluster domain-containing protein [Nitrospirota bacterium]
MNKFRPWRWRPWRWIAALSQAIIIVGLPFVKIGGQSALRFDVPTLQLHFFGSVIWIEEFFAVLAGIFFITFLFMAVTIVFGRLWCGWSCPQTVLCDISDAATKKSLLFGYPFRAILAVLVGANLLWYFVEPIEFFAIISDGLQGGTDTLLTWTWLSISILIFIDLAFIGRTFCKTVCPYAKLQSVLFDDKTMCISFDETRRKECMECAACKRVCPVGVDIREGLDMACISCAQCIDACSRQTARYDKPSMVDYYFGTSTSSWARKSSASFLTRPNAFIAFTLSIIFLGILISVSTNREPFESTVNIKSGYPARLTSAGELMNAYEISIRNLDKEDRIFNVSSPSGTILPNTPIKLVSGEVRRTIIYLIAPFGNAASADIRIRSAEISVTHEVILIYPKGRSK